MARFIGLGDQKPVGMVLDRVKLPASYFSVSASEFA